MKKDEDKWQGKTPSRWSFWKEGVTSSLLSMFLRNREELRLAAVEGWTSCSTPMGPAFGSCVHWLLERAYKRKSPPKAAWWKKTIKAYEKAWLEDVPSPTQKQLDQQEMIYGLAEQVMPVYSQRYAGDWLGGKSYPVDTKPPCPRKWGDLETRFQVLYEYTDGRTVPISGTRDALFYAIKRRLWNLDTKCLSVFNPADIEETLPFDLQQMLYLWAAYMELEDPPEGLVMNIIRRPGQRVGVSESWADYFKRVKADMTKQSRWDHYFVRIPLKVTSKEIDDWEKNFLTPVMNDIRAWWEGSGPHYLNPGALITKYGRCSLFGPLVRGDFTNCWQRKPGTVLNYQREML